MSFRSKLYQSIINNSSHNALCIQGCYYSYSQLAGRISSIQRALLANPATLQRIGLVLSDTADTYAAIVAILLLGKTYVPLHPGHPAERVQQIIAQAGLEVVLSSSASPYLGNVTYIDLSSLATEGHSPILSEGDYSNTYAYILFTSGSTGIPKGTPITYGNVDSFATGFYHIGYQLTAQDRCLQMFDLTFDLSVVSYLMPLCAGACVYTLPDKGMKFTNVYSVLEEHNITFALMVPSILSFLRQYFSEIHLPHLRYSLFCGEALPADLVTEWHKCVPNATIDNVYGPTEATIFCTWYRIDTTGTVGATNGVVWIGKPMVEVNTIVVDDEGKLVTKGEKGELCLSGNQVTPGYLDNEKNKTAFFNLNGERYYRTGDLVLLHTDGNYIYCGRSDHQVKIQGFRIELAEVEHHARKAFGYNAVAIVSTNPQGINQIELVLETEATNKSDITNTLKSLMPAYMLPTGIHFIKPLPLNINGKTDRKELAKQIATAI